MSPIQPNFAAPTGLKPVDDVNSPQTKLNQTLKNKLKLMYVYDALLALTDPPEKGTEAKSLTLAEINQYIVDKYNISIDRKCFYQLISALKASGIDIVHGSGQYARYYINERLFSLAELKLIAGAIASCKILDETSANTLLDKLKQLTSQRNAEAMTTKRVYTAGRPDANYSKELFNTIDTINCAIRDGKLISFDYYQYTTKTNGNKRVREISPGQNGNRRFVTPYELVWNNESYYLLCHYSGHDKGDEKEITHFRVDRMQNVRIVAPSNKYPYVPIADVNKDFNLRSYMSTTFSMFGGKDTIVKIRFSLAKKGIVSSVVDQFGANVSTIPDGKDHFYIKVPVKVNNPFFAWVMQFGGNAEIVEPLDVRQQYIDLLKKSLASMEK